MVKFTDSGQYRCTNSDETSQDIGNRETAQVVTVTVNSEAPQVRILGPAKRLETAGDDAVVTCMIEKGEPMPNIAWLKDGEILQLSERVRPSNSDYKALKFRML